MARIMTDPPYRADVYADVTEMLERTRTELRQRREDRSKEARVLRLWNEEVPIGAIAQTVGLTTGQVYEIVSRETDE